MHLNVAHEFDYMPHAVSQAEGVAVEPCLIQEGGLQMFFALIHLSRALACI